MQKWNKKGVALYLSRYWKGGTQYQRIIIPAGNP